MNCPIQWNIKPIDGDNTFAGYPILEGVEHFDFYVASLETGRYSHHPNIHHDGKTYFATWSNQEFGEDGSGQRALLCVSPDGKTWPDPVEIMPPMAPSRKSEEKGRVVTPVAFVPLGEELYLVAEVNDNIGFMNPEGTAFADVRSDIFSRRARTGLGRTARRITAEGAAGPVFWLESETVPPLEGFDDPLPADHPDHAATVLAINSYLEDPLHSPAWEFKHLTTRPVAADGEILCEPSTCKRPDAKLLRTCRAYKTIRRIYASVSEDGKTFPPAVRTDIPDAPSKAFAGNLPDGRVILVGNFVETGRDPLVLALSDDGITFDRAWAIRADAPPKTLDGTGGGPGFQYPEAIVADNAVHVIYSIGKEHVSLTRVPLDALR